MTPILRVLNSRHSLTVARSSFSLVVQRKFRWLLSASAAMSDGPLLEQKESSPTPAAATEYRFDDFDSSGSVAVKVESVAIDLLPSPSAVIATPSQSSDGSTPLTPAISVQSIPIDLLSTVSTEAGDVVLKPIDEQHEERSPEEKKDERAAESQPLLSVVVAGEPPPLPAPLTERAVAPAMPSPLVLPPAIPPALGENDHPLASPEPLVMPPAIPAALAQSVEAPAIPLPLPAAIHLPAIPAALPEGGTPPAVPPALSEAVDPPAIPPPLPAPLILKNAAGPQQVPPPIPPPLVVGAAGKNAAGPPLPAPLDKNAPPLPAPLSSSGPPLPAPLLTKSPVGAVSYIKTHKHHHSTHSGSGGHHHSHHHSSSGSGAHHSKHHSEAAVGSAALRSSSREPGGLDPQQSLLVQSNRQDLITLNASLLQELQYYDLMCRELSTELESSLLHSETVQAEQQRVRIAAEQAMVELEVLKGQRRREDAMKEERRQRVYKQNAALKKQVMGLKQAMRDVLGQGTQVTGATSAMEHRINIALNASNLASSNKAAQANGTSSIAPTRRRSHPNREARARKARNLGLNGTVEEGEEEDTTSSSEDEEAYLESDFGPGGGGGGTSATATDAEDTVQGTLEEKKQTLSELFGVLPSPSNGDSSRGLFLSPVPPSPSGGSPSLDDPSSSAAFSQPVKMAGAHSLLHLGLLDNTGEPVAAEAYLALQEEHHMTVEKCKALEKKLMEQQASWTLYLDLVQASHRSQLKERQRSQSTQTLMVLNTPPAGALFSFASEKLVYVTPNIWKAVGKAMMKRDRWKRTTERSVREAGSEPNAGKEEEEGNEETYITPRVPMAHHPNHTASSSSSASAAKSSSTAPSPAPTESPVDPLMRTGDHPGSATKLMQATKAALLAPPVQRADGMPSTSPTLGRSETAPVNSSTQRGSSSKSGSDVPAGSHLSAIRRKLTMVTSSSPSSSSGAAAAPNQPQTQTVPGYRRQESAPNTLSAGSGSGASQSPPPPPQLQHSFSQQVSSDRRPQQSNIGGSIAIPSVTSPAAAPAQKESAGTKLRSRLTAAAASSMSPASSSHSLPPAVKTPLFTRSVTGPASGSSSTSAGHGIKPIPMRSPSSNPRSVGPASSNSAMMQSSLRRKAAAAAASAAAVPPHGQEAKEEVYSPPSFDEPPPLPQALNPNESNFE
jgi:hypothetical protein